MNTLTHKIPITNETGMLIQPAAGHPPAFPDTTAVIEDFKRAGVLLFRGFGFDKDTFVTFSRGITPGFINYAGGAYPRDPIDGDDTVLSVTGNRQAFAVPFHGEMFYTKYRPTVLWFFCNTPPAAGGETTVCDGIQFYERLSPATKALFAKKQLKYVRHYKHGDWQKIYQSEDPADVERLCQERDTGFRFDPSDESVSTTYVTPAYNKDIYTGRTAFINNILPVIVQQSSGQEHSKVILEDDTPIPADVLTEIQEVAEELTIPLAWQTGDIAMINNTRCMHGRKAFEDMNREIFIRMARDVFN